MNKTFKEFFYEEYSIKQLQNKYKDKFSKINVYEFDNKISIDLIIAKEKGKGYGSDLMKDLCSYADSKNKTIILTPSEDFGSSVKDLIKFYKKFGFVENKGKNKIFGIFETMYRLPNTNESVKVNKGTYVGIKWPKDVSKIIVDTAKEFGVPNVLSEDDIHSTLIYSRNEFNHIPSKENFKFSTIGPNNSRESRLDIFGNALVIKIYSKQMEDRHKEIMENNPEATYDYPEYIPHITISYDIQDYDISNFDYEQLSERLEDGSGGIEYTETLDPEWFSKN